MKIDVSGIVVEHYRTLYDANTHRYSRLDIVVFVAIPLLLAAATYICNVAAPADFFSISVSFYGIFIALLLNIQVIIFSIFQRIWRVPDGARLQEIQRQDVELRRTLITELNANISYLIVFACFALVIIIVMDVVNWKSCAPTAIIAAVYSHFMLTLLMVIRRSYALFQREYRDAPPSP